MTNSCWLLQDEQEIELACGIGDLAMALLWNRARVCRKLYSLSCMGNFEWTLDGYTKLNWKFFVNWDGDKMIVER